MQMNIGSTVSLPLAALMILAAALSAPAHAQTPAPLPDAPAPASQQPASQQPATQQPATQQPATQQPATQQPAAQPAAADLPDSPGASIQPKVVIEPTGPLVVIDTNMGRLSCRLFDKQSPLAAANFIGLAQGTKDWTDPTTGQKVHGKPYYDNTTFHRVIPGFMIQGGDRKGDGSGDAGFYFKNETTPGLAFDVPGRLAMANAGPDTNGTQFFITEVPYPDLDGKYTIFGQCDTHTVLMVATLARVDRDSNDKPATPITMNKVTIVREGDPMPPQPAAAVSPASNPSAAPVPPTPSPK
jgi:peptidyl-prolyl cis-trans isomerase A (cyclophilin A)